MVGGPLDVFKRWLAVIGGPLLGVFSRWLAVLWTYFRGGWRSSGRILEVVGGGWRCGWRYLGGPVQAYNKLV